MGAGSSSKIKKFHVDQENNDVQKLQKKTGRKETPGQGNDQQGEVEAVNSGTNVDDLEELTKQLCESESQRLDLEDRVQCLEEQLETMKAKSILSEELPCDETLHVKDQYIGKLEKEKKLAETQHHKMKVKLHRKVKEFKTDMAEYKQEVNFQMMELRDEIQRLKVDDKEKESQKAKDTLTVLPDVQDAPTKLPGGEKMKLILELSAQVTEQEDKIASLDHKLKDKNHTIEQLRRQMKGFSQYSSVLSDTKAGMNEECGDGKPSIGMNPSQMINTKPTRSIGTGKRVRTKKDIDSDSDDSMAKLSSLLQGVTVPKTLIRASDALEEQVINKVVKENQQNVPQSINLVDELDSGTGRDSGLGSAGKREEEQIVKKVVSSNVLPDWVDSASGLSDSDFERDSFGTKVCSAPPHMQGERTRKLKKKSNSLKKRASSFDKPGKPGMAFVEEVGLAPGLPHGDAL